MPFFSFSLKHTEPSLKKYNITSNNLYFSKNTQLWTLLNKQDPLNINLLKKEERLPVKKITNKILFCLPPSIGLGDAIEYASALKAIYDNLFFDKFAIAFTGDYSFIFQNYFGLKNTYIHIIKKSEIEKYQTVFHLTLEIKSLIYQKYIRSNIYDELLSFFNIKKNKEKKNRIKKNYKVNKISIFPISSSPIRSMPIKILRYIIDKLIKNYDIEIFIDNRSEISNLITNDLDLKNVSLIDSKNKLELFQKIKNIEYGIFMDSGPLHVAKLFNKRGILIETSVSNNILLNNYDRIKSVKNKYLSSFCKAPCGLVDIFNYKSNYGCYDSLEIESSLLKEKDFNGIISRGVKNHHLKNYKNPVRCLSSLNVQNIYNIIIKDLSL